MTPETSTAAVIGGASGIGWASARALAANGYRVVVADVNLEGARNRAAELGAPQTAGYVDKFRSVVDVCLTGALIVAKYAGRHLVDGGSLVSISSLNARQPAIGMSAYCSAKAGLSMLTQVAAMELAVRGIRVNAIAPASSTPR